MNIMNDDELEAIEVLKGHGWQIVACPHLEDWEEGRWDIKDEHGDTATSIRASFAVFKL